MRIAEFRQLQRGIETSLDSVAAIGEKTDFHWLKANI